MQTANVTGNITTVMVDELNGTRPWTLFIAIMLFIAAAFMFLGTGIMLLALVGMSTTGNSDAAPVMIGVIVFYALFAVLYLMLGIYLAKFSSAISRLVQTGRPDEMSQALDQQRKFWKMTGILMLVGVVLMIVWIAAVIALPELMRGMN